MVLTPATIQTTTADMDMTLQQYVVIITRRSVYLNKEDAPEYAYLHDEADHFYTDIT
jgi:hypothetical protein